jgi:hypothetical protein
VQAFAKLGFYTAASQGNICLLLRPSKKKYPSTLKIIYNKETYIIGIEFIYLYFEAKLHIRCRLKTKAFEGEPQGAAPPPPLL